MRSAILFSSFGVALWAAIGCASPSPPGSAPPAADPPGVKAPATYAGTLPCADCPGIEWTLTLLDDGSYRLRQVYLEAEDGEDRAFVQAGRWDTAGRDDRLVLRRRDEGPIHVEVKGTETLRLLDQQGRPIESRLNYELQRLAEVDRIADEGPGTPAPLVGTHWRLTELPREDGFAVDPELGAHLVLGDAEDRVSGSSGCNRLVGTFALEGDALSLGPLAGTRMACLPPAMELERRFHAALEAVTGYSIDGDTLTLMGPDGPLARFERHLEQAA